MVVDGTVEFVGSHGQKAAAGNFLKQQADKNTGGRLGNRGKARTTAGTGEFFREGWKTVRERPKT